MNTEIPVNNNEVAADLPLPKRSWKQRLAAICIILFILAAGVGVAVVLIKTKPVAQRKSPPKMKVLVDTATVAPTSTRVTVEALGRMVPARQITLQARAAGTVKYLHPQFLPGGILRKGEVIVRLDDTDYRLELQRRQNTLQQALADLRLEEGNQAVARQEWEMIKRQSEELDTTSDDLVLRKPQMEKAQADIASARTDVERGEVDLDRTVIKAPFNAVVIEKNIDLGSQVGSQTAIASLVGIDSFWAEVSVPVDKLDWLRLPEKELPGSPALVYSNNHKPHTGRIIRLLPDVEKEGLMARLLIEVDDPMSLGDGGAPLLLSSFVRAEIEGKVLDNVFQVPRASLKDEKAVLLVTEERTLHIQPVSVLWKNNQDVFVDGGLQTGDRIVVSQVAAPVEGMPLILNGIDEDAGQPSIAEQEKEHE
jgi:RND family efflux transporter MFP subunit